MGIERATKGLTGTVKQAKENNGKLGLNIDGKWYIASKKVFEYASQNLVGKEVEVTGVYDDSGAIAMLKAKGGAKPSGGGKGGGRGGYGGGKSDPDYALGQQVGNAITNAATILGAGASVEQLGKAARQIILLGNTLKEEIKAGKISATKATSQPEPSQPTSSDGFDGGDSFDTPNADFDDDAPW